MREDASATRLAPRLRPSELSPGLLGSLEVSWLAFLPL